MTAGAPAVSFNKSIYHSVTNTGPTHKKLGRFALRVCERFKWLEQVLLLFHDQKVDDRPCYFAMEGIFEELGKANITRVDRVFNEKLLPVNYSDIIPDIQQTGRGESVWVRSGRPLRSPLFVSPSSRDVRDGWQKPKRWGR